MVAILIIVLLTIMNGIFAMAEAAVISARKAKLQQRANAGDAQARAALELADNPNRFLSTVQVGITLIGILAGAFGEATLADDLETWLADVPWLAPYSQAISLGLMVVILTYLSLIIGELVPKRLALRNPERIAGLVAAPMNFLSKVVNPAVYILSVSTEVILRLLRIQPSTEPPVTEEEIKVLIQQGTQAGVFEALEQDMVEAVFRLHDQRAFDLMTPRPEIIWLDTNDPPETAVATITESGYSRFPVCRGGLDHVLGIVRAKDLLARSLAGQPFDLKTVLRLPIFVPESALASHVLELFRGNQPHLALVIDEYGGTQGLVTLHDILEAIVGEVEVAEPQAVQRPDGSWLLDGALSVEEFKEIFTVEALPGEERGYYQTLGGFVMMSLGRVPMAGDNFQWASLKFEVMDMDGKRVDKILVAPISVKAAL
jgi:putative hemolysin